MGGWALLYSFATTTNGITGDHFSGIRKSDTIQKRFGISRNTSKICRQALDVCHWRLLNRKWSQKRSALNNGTLKES